MESPEPTSDEARDSGLREITARQQVTFRVDPALEMVGNARVVVGYDVELAGAHPPHVSALPGCARCELIWTDLHRIATSLRQRIEGRASVTKESGFRPAITTSHWGDGTPRDEVRLTLSIRHRDGYFEPLDDCEAACLKETIGALKHLGAKEEGVG